jgi:hypothetical protein
MTIQELGKRFKTHFGFNPPIDMISTMARGPQNARLDIIKLDEMFAQRDTEYNADECTYKELENVSMAKYVELKYGNEAFQFIKSLLQ